MNVTYFIFVLCNVFALKSEVLLPLGPTSLTIIIIIIIIINVTVSVSVTIVTIITTAIRRIIHTEKKNCLAEGFDGLPLPLQFSHQTKKDVLRN